VADAAQALRVAFAGVEVGDWVDPTGETRDVAVRLHPDDRVDASNIERLPIAVSGSNRMVPLEQIATVTMGKGPSDPACRWQAHDLGVGQRAGPLARAR
jgi:HAE1 family hydrophobic/amphiphilic exporter-1